MGNKYYGYKRLHIVHTESSCGWGGQEIRILNESVGVIEQGHRVTILCVEGSQLHSEAINRNINVVTLPFAKKTLKGLLAVRRWLMNHEVDVVNTHSSTDAWLVAVARVFLRKNFAVVRTRHVSAPIHPNVATRWLYRKGCDFVVTTGERLRRHVMEKVALSPDRVLSVPTGVDTQQFFLGDKKQARRQCDLPQDISIIGIVATLRSWKGHVYLIEALAKLQYDNLFLLIVGDGPNRSNIDAAIQKLGVSDRVIFAGQQNNVVPWLQAMDVFVLPSYANEGVPQSLMQAMACGIPVVSTPVGSIDELVIDREMGVLVKPRSSTALVDVLQPFFDGEWEKDYTVNAKKHIDENFSSLSMNHSMSDVFISCWKRL